MDAIIGRLRDGGGYLRDGSTDADLHAALNYLRADADALGLDPTRLALFATSGNVTVALSALMHDPQIRCAALFYGYTMDLGESTVVADMSRQYGFVNACAGRSVNDLPDSVPMLFVRAGREHFPGVNDALDRVIAAALTRNLPFTLINHSTGAHGFDLDEDTDVSRGIIQQVVAFLRFSPRCGDLLKLGRGTFTSGRPLRARRRQAGDDLLEITLIEVPAFHQFAKCHPHVVQDCARAIELGEQRSNVLPGMRHERRVGFHLIGRDLVHALRHAEGPHTGMGATVAGIAPPQVLHASHSPGARGGFSQPGADFVQFRLSHGEANDARLIGMPRSHLRDSRLRGQCDV
jgi:acetyl esterase/lipase